MLACASLLLCLPSAITLAVEQGGASQPLPPEVRIVSFQISTGPALRNSVWHDSRIPTTGDVVPTGNVPFRAEYGVEPGTGLSPVFESRRSRIPGYGDDSVERETQLTEARLTPENAGPRTIQAVEWEYAWLKQRNQLALPSDLKNAKWKRVKSKVRIQPGEIVQLKFETLTTEREPGGGVFVFGTPLGVRIARVRFTAGPDWRAP